MKKTLEIRKMVSTLTLSLGMLLLFATPAFAHCDSYDGPVIQDAYKALENKNVAYILKWIDAEQEKEVITLFDKTVRLKNEDVEIYNIVEKHFLETLVRLHRETEGAPYTGLKPAGSTTAIVQMADNSIASKEVKTMLTKLNKHIQGTITEKYEKVMKLEKVKDNSVAEGRAYVEAYVDYTHTLEAIEAVLEHGGHH